MNNLKKWILSLTNDEIIDITYHLRCEHCPAFNYCDNDPNSVCRNCLDIVLEWASKEDVKSEKGNL